MVRGGARGSDDFQTVESWAWERGERHQFGAEVMWTVGRSRRGGQCFEQGPTVLIELGPVSRPVGPVEETGELRRKDLQREKVLTNRELYQ